ncbi:glycosyltransferase [Limnobaculum parvum]|uniref:Glycosyltransferase n=1 Tax=Limnobaculum parvum TaxID=2172103 RepID=A0A2Y9TZ75_9GAMM|nr:glycosyltransferase [Limnobaculum parvum]AWH88684.1 glycosyltransferase [Limnobaculum parvum]
MVNEIPTIKKIILILPFLEGRGGMETVMTTLIPMIKADGIQIKLFMLGKEKQHYKEWLESIEYESSMCTHKSKKVRNLVYITALTRYLFREKPDIVICTNALTCLIADLARKIGRGDYPIVSWSHGSIAEMSKKEDMLRADFHLAIASGITQQLTELGEKKSNIYTIFNPCKPADRIIPRPTNKHKFAYLGRILFGDEKRLKDILDAFSTIENEFELHIIGDGKDMELTRNYAHQLSIYPKIIWHGWQHDPWEALHDITAIILASTHEGFGMVLAEAAARGVYSISSNCPTGPEDIIQDGINGILFEPRDVQTLHNIIINIMDGEILPDQKLIQSSAQKFYPENYYTRFKTSLISIMERWNNKSV